ncbi:MAG: Ni,Fe-hydrogenase III large subunit [Gammaproteobacteria bacterium]|nr:MAG: Ni,Fe-hydrogenase III large subunit [Gammaproteobacteria bacterium]
MHFIWLNAFLGHARRNGVRLRKPRRQPLEPALLYEVEAAGWGRVAATARRFGMRWADTWAVETEEGFLIQSLLEYRGDYLLLRTGQPLQGAVLESQAPAFPAALRVERAMRDLFGIDFSGEVDRRRWIRHQAWTAQCHPLRKEFPAHGSGESPVPPDLDYPFLQARGTGVVEIPVGPVHAGIIEPGHFRFQAVGEQILNLEERLGYLHRGVEKLAEGRDAISLARLAGRVSGDTTVAHAWAACQAMERAAGVQVPDRALFLRALLAERERIANHLGDIGAVCNDVGFAFAMSQFGRLRELWLRMNGRLFGHRLLMDRVVPGGVTIAPDQDAIDDLRQEAHWLRGELETLVRIVENTPSLQDRLIGTGILDRETALELGTLGYVARASGVRHDLRAESPCAPYDRLRVTVPVHETGDVADRLRVRADEINASLDLILQILNQLPEGPERAGWTPPPAGAEGLGLLEGWRGEVVAYVRFGGEGKVDRYHPRDPSVLNWPALERLVRGNIVPDFPVCNKSVNGSYAGHDL